MLFSRWILQTIFHWLALFCFLFLCGKVKVEPSTGTHAFVFSRNDNLVTWNKSHKRKFWSNKIPRELPPFILFDKICVRTGHFGFKSCQPEILHSFSRSQFSNWSFATLKTGSLPTYSRLTCFWRSPMFFVHVYASFSRKKDIWWSWSRITPTFLCDRWRVFVMRAVVKSSSPQPQQAIAILENEIKKVVRYITEKNTAKNARVTRM